MNVAIVEHPLWSVEDAEASTPNASPPSSGLGAAVASGTAGSSWRRRLGDDGAMTDRMAVADWIARYERAWRSPGTDGLDELFTGTASYSPSPWARPVEGLEAIRAFWDASRTGPDEGFRMHSEIVAIDGDVAVVRVAVDYEDGQRWRDLWVLAQDGSGRCERFEEWPFAPGQPDGHDDDS